MKDTYIETYIANIVGLKDINDINRQTLKILVEILNESFKNNDKKLFNVTQKEIKELKLRMTIEAL